MSGFLRMRSFHSDICEAKKIKYFATVNGGHGLLIVFVSDISEQNYAESRQCRAETKKKLTHRRITL